MRVKPTFINCMHLVFIPLQVVGFLIAIDSFPKWAWYNWVCITCGPLAVWLGVVALIDLVLGD